MSAQTEMPLSPVNLPTEDGPLMGVGSGHLVQPPKFQLPKTKMSKDPLHIYLAKERANGAYSFSLRVQPPRYIGDTEVRFTIHPELQSGETNDYAVSEDPERPDSDFIYNEAAIPEPDVEKFLAKLREHRLVRETLG